MNVQKSWHCKKSYTSPIYTTANQRMHIVNMSRIVTQKQGKKGAFCSPPLISATLLARLRTFAKSWEATASSSKTTTTLSLGDKNRWVYISVFHVPKYSTRWSFLAGQLSLAISNILGILTFRELSGEWIPIAIHISIKTTK